MASATLLGELPGRQRSPNSIYTCVSTCTSLKMIDVAELSATSGPDALDTETKLTLIQLSIYP